MSGHAPPSLPRQLRDRLPPELLGDLDEGFVRRMEAGRGRFASSVWYYVEVARFLVRIPRLPVREASAPAGWFDMIRQDVGFAVRALSRRPVLSSVVVATLALAIGANATIFSLISSLFFGSVGVDEPERVVEIYGSSERDADVGGFQGFLPISHPNLEDLRERTTTLDGLYAYTLWPVSVELGDRAERSQAMYVSGEYFHVLGVDPHLGRVFRPEEDDIEGGAPVAVVSHGLWEERLGADPDALGRTFRLNARSYTVVGVAPPGFRGTSATVGADIWVPLSMIIDVPVWGPLWQNRGARFFFVGARAGAGRSLTEVESDVESAWATLAEEYPDVNGAQGVQLVPLLEARVTPSVRGVVASASAVLMAVVAVLLLIACMNVANLLLARSLARGREMAIRTSVGAGRGRLVAQLLTESLVLFGLGGLAGLLVATWGQGALSGLQPPALFGATLDVQTDLRVVAFTAGVTIACGLLFGLIPALRASGTDVSGQLRDGDRAGTSGRGRMMRNGLVAGQVCLSLVALVGAGLFLRALGEANRVPLGFEPEDLTLLSVDLGSQGYTEAEGRVFYRDALQRIEGLPEVETVAIGSLRPLSFGPLRAVLGEDEDPDDPEAGTMVRETLVTPGYLDALGTRLIRGRALSEADDEDAPPVAVINQRMADVYWSGEEAVGRRFRVRLPPREVTVVGVIETAKQLDIGEDPAPEYLMPAEQSHPPSATFFVRTRPGTEGVAERVRRELQALDPSLPVFDVMPASALVGQATWNTRAITVLLGAFGLVGLLLAAVGIYGVVATSVRERTREIGLRMALGAEAGEMTRQVVAGSLTVAALGVATGLVLAALLTRPLAPQLFGVAPTDVLTYGTTAAVLVVVAAFSAYVPARRAARVDPTEALRAE